MQGRKFPEIAGAFLFGVLLAGPVPAQSPPVKDTKAPPPLPGSKVEMPASPPGGKGETSPVTAPVSVMQVKVALPGDFSYRFIGKTFASAPAPLPAGTDTAPLPVPPEIKPAESTLEILDNTRNTLARKRVSLTGVTPVLETDFAFAQVVYVPVQANGKGITDAQVSVTNAKGSYSRRFLLKPQDEGTARFDSVPLDEDITIAVAYGKNPPERVIKQLSRGQADGFRLAAIVVRWPDAKTVAPSVLPSAPALSSSGGSAAGTPAMQTPAAPAASAGGGLGGILSTLIGLVFLGGIGYALYTAYNQGRLKTLFDKLGIQTQPLTADGPVPDPFSKSARTPIQPITDGTADPLLAGGAVVGTAAAPLPGNGPRLVATGGTYSGSIFPLDQPSLEAGRDAMLAIAMPNDTNASRRHATFQTASGQVTITDNGSSNGTYVNGIQLTSQVPQRLRPGDEIQIGLTRFRFEA